MNNQLKKKIRGLIREHFTNKTNLTYEQKKSMYWIFGIMDEVLEKIDTIDLLSIDDPDKLVKIQVLDSLFDILKTPFEEQVDKIQCARFASKGSVFTMTVKIEKAEE